MKILTNSVDKLPVLVTVLLKRARAVSGLPAGTPIEVVDDPQAEDIRITLGTVKGYKGDAYKTLSPKQIVSNPQSILFLAQALQYGYLGPIDPGLELGKDWVVWEGQDISFKEGSVIALDIESAGDIDNDTFAAGRILSVALWNGKFGVVIPEEIAETPESAELIERLCRDCIVVCHNGTFDMPYLSKRLGINVYHHEDTLLMHFVLDNLAGEHGLKPLARRWLRAADWDSDAKSYLKHGAYFENIPRDKLYRYNIYDAYWTYELYKYFKPMIDKAPDFYKHRMRVTRVLHDVQMNGVAVSFTALDELEEKYNRQCNEHLVTLKKLAGEDFNPQSPKQIAEYFASKGVSSPSFDAKHLKKLKRADKESEFINALLAYRYAAKVIGSFIANVRRKRGEDRRIHPYYLPHGAKTGRLSAKGPAIQTMGRDSGIKRALVAAPGCKIISCDYSQAELRTVAELADDTAMIAAFQPGGPDFFDGLMTKIWPDEYPTIEAYEAFKHEHPKTAKNKRALVKSVVYGCVPLNYPILTAEGWKSVDDLVEGELVYAADATTGQLVTTPLRKINRYSNAPVNTYSTRGFNVTTTPNHKWVVSKRRKGKSDEIALTEACDIKHDDKIMLAYPYLSNHDDGYTDEEVQLISWVVSDGYLHRSKTNHEIRGILMQIMQAKPQYVEEIKNLMTNFSHSVDKRPGVNYETAYTWRVHAEDARRVWDKSAIGDEKENLCRWVLSLNARHLEMFVDIFNKAEGYFDNGTWVVAQKHGYTADAYRLAAFLCGKYVTSSEYKEGGMSKYHVRKKSFVTAQKLVVKDGGTTDVWCPTTDYGTWVTQDENGSIIVTGNSNYGRGVPAIATALEQPIENAQHVYDQYFGTYTGLRDWQQKVRHSIGRKEENYMRRTKFGMSYNPLFVPDAAYASIQNEALAFVPQSTANDICLNAAIKINEQVGQYGAKLIGLVHDATYVECPEETVEECSRMMEREMSKAATLVFNRVPFVAEAEVGNNWEEV
jgi:DNA polymerase I-like protein with 3'-5' exonuclease and polymerase domains|nr:MAG TPA: DNA polymerase [Caudoviricetes sp.]